MKRSLLFIGLAFIFCRVGCNCEDGPHVPFRIENTLTTDVEIALSGYRVYGNGTTAVDKTLSVKAGETIVIHSASEASLFHHVSDDTLLFFDALEIKAGNETTDKDFSLLSEWDYKDGSRYKLVISEDDF